MRAGLRGCVKSVHPMKAFFTVLLLSIVTAGSIQAEPVNEKCPVCGKGARLIFRTRYQGKHIIFFSADCMEKFEKSPSTYSVKPKS